jgi:spore maturation protein CgeB
LPAAGYGKGWDSGIVEFKAMLEIFSRSKINLNFTESPYVTFKEKLKFLAKIFIKKQRGKYRFDFDPIGGLQAAQGAQRRQIKARTFEIPACGGFLLTGMADNIEDYYIDGKEIVIFKNLDDLTEKCRYYLNHEEERLAIAEAGYKRTLLEHTYEKRFADIFKAMELM